MWRFRALLATGVTLIVAGAVIGLTPFGRSAQAATANVVIADFRFTDSASGTLTTTVNDGDSVMWAWTGAYQHSVTADDGSFDDPPNSAKANGTFSHAFNTPGTYAYHCRIHGGPGTGMHGVIVVQAAATNTVTNTLTSTITAVSATSAPPTNTPVPSTIAATPLASTTTAAATAVPASAVATSTKPALIAPAPTGGAAGAAAGHLPLTGTGTAGSDQLSWLAMGLVLSGATVAGGVIVLRRCITKPTVER